LRLFILSKRVCGSFSGSQKLRTSRLAEELSLNFRHLWRTGNSRIKMKNTLKLQLAFNPIPRIVIDSRPSRWLDSSLHMQRVCSILAMFAVLCPVVSPLWASAMHTAEAASCHRMPLGKARPTAHPAHHCHYMDAAGQQTSNTGRDTAVLKSGSPERCPMNCCLQAAPPTTAALPAASFVPALVVSRTQVHFLPVTFTSTGFSSHTDRGPPSL
jgi:hypothetical protein